jgi:hypothetical protein
MSAAQSPGGTDAEVIDGWVVDDPDVYHYLTGHNPPRPACHVRQLRSDARSREVRRLWIRIAVFVAAGAAATAAGYLLDELSAAVAVTVGGAVWMLSGVVMFAFYLRAFASTVRGLRTGWLLRGQVFALAPHTNIRRLSKATAVLPDDRTVTVSVPTATAAEFIDRDGRVEVLFLTDDDRRGWGIGLRSVSRPGSL